MIALIRRVIAADSFGRHVTGARIAIDRNWDGAGADHRRSARDDGESRQDNLISRTEPEGRPLLIAVEYGGVNWNYGRCDPR